MLLQDSSLFIAFRACLIAAQNHYTEPRSRLKARLVSVSHYLFHTTHQQKSVTIVIFKLESGWLAAFCGQQQNYYLTFHLANLKLILCLYKNHVFKTWLHRAEGAMFSLTPQISAFQPGMREFCSRGSVDSAQ